MKETGDLSKEDNQFDMYRKRMMLAYKFRPNPLVCCFSTWYDSCSVYIEDCEVMMVVWLS